MTKIALIGAGGYIGSSLFKKLSKRKDDLITPVFRHNYEELKKKEYDIVINCAMPSKRYWAKNNPTDDFKETVLKTADIVYGWKYQKLVQISTISARSEKHSIYGKHKFIAETLCRNSTNLIVRLTATFDETLTKGVLIDILNNRDIHVGKKSAYSFASLDFVTNWISDHLDETGIIEVGAKNSLTLENISDFLRIKINCSGPSDIQVVKNPRNEFPDAKKVIDFLRSKISLLDS